MPEITHATETTTETTSAEPTRNGKIGRHLQAGKTAKPTKKTPTRANVGKAKGNDKPLRLGQVRMLKALKRADKPLPRTKLIEAACPGRENPTLDGSYIGQRDPKARAKTDKKFGPSLLTRGYIREVDVDGVTEFAITASGKAALAKAE